MKKIMSHFLIHAAHHVCVSNKSLMHAIIFVFDKKCGEKFAIYDLLIT